MGKLLNDIFNIWKDASNTYSKQVSFTVNYTSTVVEFMRLLETWRVPYKVVYNEFRASITTTNYNDFIINKLYYSDNGITAEMETEYYE